MTCSLTCQHLCHQVSRCLPRLFPTKQDQHYSPTEHTDLQWKFNHPPSFKAVKVVQVGHKWQSNHYKVRVEQGEEEEQVSLQTNRVISTFWGSPSEGSPLWEFDLSESVWSREMWGQTQTMGKGTNGRAITGLQAELHFKRGQMAFSSPLKALGKSDVMHKGQALCWLTDTRGRGQCYSAYVHTA